MHILCWNDTDLMAKGQRGEGSGLYHHVNDFRYDCSGINWSTRVSEKRSPWGIQGVKRFEIDMFETGLFSCRVEKEFDSVCVCFPQAQADTAHDLERDLLSFPAVNDLNCNVRTSLSFVDRSLRSL
jgi:hypothetical protein